ncbi:UNKNOWN [Stylonychia lemnae]|uniref:TRP C-terminal domain-containing protein n=1 Tax=Stylonychia lemnae TaxID=5949 RepID=A0A078A067_STYLE|nr:UNKNOWN [Stylonychia lemnae]|eukprot:CDW75586.1 UNKNOWN [Stylonychia lemnae]
MFYDFKCYEIEYEMRLLNDLEVICWSPQHSFFSFFFALPSIIIWGIGIPAFAYFLMRKVRNQLSKLESKEMYGFLYRGFKKEFYYWEIVIMYRKMILILVSVFVRSFGVLAQALFVFFLLICFLIITMRNKPYSTLELNNLEIVSIVTSMISIYCGMFFITDLPEKWVKENPDFSKGAVILDPNTKLAFFIIIVSSNGFFFCYWIIKMIDEIIQKIRNSFPKIYLFMCACGDVNKLDRQRQLFDVQQQNQIIQEKYFIALARAKKQIKQAKIELNQENYEKVLKEIDPEMISKIVQDVNFQEYDELTYNKRQYRIIQNWLNRVNLNLNDKPLYQQENFQEQQNSSISQYQGTIDDQFSNEFDLQSKIRNLTPQTDTPGLDQLINQDQIQYDSNEISISDQVFQNSSYINDKILAQDIQQLKIKINGKLHQHQNLHLKIQRQQRNENTFEFRRREMKQMHSIPSFSELDAYEINSMDSSKIVTEHNITQNSQLAEQLFEQTDPRGKVQNEFEINEQLNLQQRPVKKSKQIDDKSQRIKRFKQHKLIKESYITIQSFEKD